MPLYHATFTKNIPLIRRAGLLINMPPIWARGDGTAYHVGDYVYAFEQFNDAVLWAAKMGWTFFKNSGSSDICIVEILDLYSWQEDGNDPLGRAASHGRWMRRQEAVTPQSIGKIVVLTASLVRYVSDVMQKRMTKGEKQWKRLR